MISVSVSLSVGETTATLDGGNVDLAASDGSHWSGRWRADRIVGVQLPANDLARLEQAIMRVTARREEKAAAKAAKHRRRSQQFRQSSRGRG